MSLKSSTVENETESTSKSADVIIQEPHGISEVCQYWFAILTQFECITHCRSLTPSGAHRGSDNWQSRTYERFGSLDRQLNAQAPTSPRTISPSSLPAPVSEPECDLQMKSFLVGTVNELKLLALSAITGSKVISQEKAQRVELPRVINGIIYECFEVTCTHILMYKS